MVSEAISWFHNQIPEYINCGACIIDGCSAEDDEPLIDFITTPNITFDWPETEIGHSISQPCPCLDLIGSSLTPKRLFINITRRCGGSYSMGGRWEEVDYQPQCGLTDIALKLCQATIVSICDCIMNITSNLKSTHY